MFFLLNGKKLTATQADATFAVLGIVVSEISEQAFAEWIRRHTTVRS
ncbi:MAG: hypothetical protein Q8N02_10910 [Methylotenera sp.]|nr:hypothetical protein [Methylotenera sp.]MDO9233300.1 hypothetical protein [Methylotenera sp.]MDO9388357.1 hypothetical protein [Methylotenera sp.]MDP2101803.1 hypothetical protein [Methylotenera sp.]MDP2280505.1 hypothetical protein [Methylotenera sp.]